MQSAQEYENDQDYIRAIRELETIVNINTAQNKLKRSNQTKAELENYKAKRRRGY